MWVLNYITRKVTHLLFLPIQGILSKLLTITETFSFCHDLKRPFAVQINEELERSMAYNELSLMSDGVFHATTSLMALLLVASKGML